MVLTSSLNLKNLHDVTNKNSIKVHCSSYLHTSMKIYEKY